MTNRFTQRKKHIHVPHGFLRFLLFPAALIIFLLLLSSVQQTTLEKQQESLETAIERDITHCYAVEGYYPPSLSYMEEHYGLTYDQTLFFVDYKPIGSNIRPDVTIIVKSNTDTAGGKDNA